MPIDRQSVLIAGGGVGGLEAALALRALAPERVAVHMLTPASHFTYRPLSVGEPFGHGRAVEMRLTDVADERGFALTCDALGRIEPDAKRVVTQDGAALDYDALILAMGARVADAVPGALTFRGPGDVERFGSALEALAGHAEPRVVFATGGGASWTLPLYELALMTAGWATNQGIAAHVSIVTAEPSPLHAFGEDASHELAELLAESGISVRTRCAAGFVDERGLHLAEDGTLAADLVVALPALSGPGIQGLPADSMGFLEVDGYCRVRGVKDVYAIGDCASRAIKQGGLAAQQADVAAASIAAWAGETLRPEPYEPVLRGLLLTGGRPLYLRAPKADQRLGPSGDAGLVEPWWPPHKIVGAHLGTYLATHADLLVPATK